MSLQPSAIDLTTVAAVKAWLSTAGQTTSTADDDTIQSCITSFSSIFLKRTGLGPMDDSIPDISPFVEPCPYDEIYDGNGHWRMFLRNRPVQSVSQLTIGTQNIIQSAGYGQNGFVIDAMKLSISLRGRYFCKGIQNVEVVYMAGFEIEPPDIEMAARRAAALNYKRKDWVGILSKSLAQGAGSITYAPTGGTAPDGSGGFEYDTEVERVISIYSRYAVI